MSSNPAGRFVARHFAWTFEIGAFRMSLRTANLLTLGGFCVVYFGLMGSLLAINVPVDFHAQKLAVLLLGSIALIGLAVMSVGRLTRVDGDGGDPPTPRIGDP